MNEMTPSKPEWALTRRDRKRLERAAAGKRPRRKWPFVLAALVALGAGGYFVLAGSTPPEAPAEAEIAEPVMQISPSEVTVIAPRRLERTVRVTGSLVPMRQAQVAAQVNGPVDSVNFRPGDTVSAGDVLVQVDIRNFQVQLSQQRSTAQATRTQLELAETQLERTRTLVDRGLSPANTLEQSQSNVDGLRANLAALEAQVETAEISIENATVRAPFDGVVSERLVEPGQTISAGTPLMGLVDLSSMEVRATASLTASAQIAEGQDATLSIEGLPNRSFEAEVRRINPVAVEGTRTIPVYLTLDNPDGVLRGGMFATGNVVVAAKDGAIAVPTAAIREDAEGEYVLKIDADRTHRQVIARGESWGGGLVEITSGVAEGDMLVTAPLAQVEPDMAIRMVEL
ncbi:efflux RND transporter periplasmic adaptor subunit [Arsenicitalea aurantiaca]|uniref:Efflux RND transporter periplasmic adaptor subunit n=1 Tax=Arsenicitalea aurantiaca TaxID=1783274 RepID=A0A433XL84_9HYPH|nr:efflux RND transporter periplasmic adaptor subunit [Arsenicitalea aurantiaca]RUT34847.1 efflux RND transporter periplasmic adaptor subunit [Arsenicitalea aurantiaca]